MERSRDTISWESWVSEETLSESARQNRKRCLRLFSKANNKESPGEVLDEIFLDKITPYEAAKNLQRFMRERGDAPSVTNLYRSLMPHFFESVLGTRNLDRKVFDRLVPKGDAYLESEKKAPTVEQFKQMLRIAKSPRDKSLLEVLSFGFRIGEALRLKIKQIQPVKNGEYYRVELLAPTTKTRKKRFVFLTKEAKRMIDDGRMGETSEWVFPGNKGQHLTNMGATKIIDKIYVRAGLENSTKTVENQEGKQIAIRELYSPHSLRTFAQSVMRRCGLNDTWVKVITGHTLGVGSDASYLDWDEIGEEWFEKCSEKMSWLTEPQTVLLTAQKAELEQLRTEVEKLKGEQNQAMAELRQLPPEYLEAILGVVKMIEEKKKDTKQLPDNSGGNNDNPTAVY